VVSASEKFTNVAVLEPAATAPTESARASTAPRPSTISLLIDVLLGFATGRATYSQARDIENETDGSPYLPVQVREHREHAAMVLRRRGEPELPEDARHVLLDRAWRDEEPLADRLVRATLRHQLEHLRLARRQLGDGVVAAAAADELAHDRG